MTEVRSKLEDLGLDEYSDSFISEGFDSWDTLVQITEDDLKDLNVKLGHRRKLQKAIADWKQEFESPTSATGHGKASNNLITPSTEFGQGVPRLTSQYSEGDQSVTSSGRIKRKYRRHPKPDPHSPERPVSAYVLFSNNMRDRLKDQELSFTEMAKIVGEKWQLLPMETREQYDRHAAAAKEKYNAELAEYKKTDQYAQYQQYLADFKARHSPQNGDDKRARLRTETSNDTQSSRDSHDNVPTSNRRRSVNSMYSTGSDALRQESPVTSAAQYSSNGSPISVRRSYINPSPSGGLVTSLPNFLRHHHSDSSTLEPTHHNYLNAAGSASISSHRLSGSYSYPHSDSAYHSTSDSHPTSNSSTTTSLSHQSSLDSSAPPSASLDRHSRSPPSPMHSLMAADANRRILPPPKQSSSARPLEHRLPTTSSAISDSPQPLPEDPRSIPSLAALLQAGELAREAERRNASASGV